MISNNPIVPPTSLSPIPQLPPPYLSLHPKLYVAPKTSTPIIVDGDPFKSSWSSIPWSSAFDDIRGEDDVPSPKDRPSPSNKTRFKLQWDDEFLYVLALIHSDMIVETSFTERNTPIYQKDSDFEVFLDPMGSCHSYKELEVNAWNTVWNLMLDRPYMDGGREMSGRVAKEGEEDYYDVKRQQSSVRILRGDVNREVPKGDDGNLWALEMAFAHSDTTYRQASLYPQIGSRWRINFSRVELEGDINWTWQPQRIWDPVERRYVGKVNMHLPDAWGYVHFSPTLEECDIVGEVPAEDIVDGSVRGDPIWGHKLLVMGVYYAQRRFKELYGEYAVNLRDLEEFVDGRLMAIFEPSCDMKLTSVPKDDGKGYNFDIKDTNTGISVSVTDEHLLAVETIGRNQIFTDKL